MSGVAIAGLCVAVWLLTLCTFFAGYNAGKTAGFSIGKVGGKLDDGEK